MNRDETIDALVDLLNEDTLSPREYAAVSSAVKMLSGPGPNIETELAPCGCGSEGKVVSDLPRRSVTETTFPDGTRQTGNVVEYPGNNSFWVVCQNKDCRCSVGYCGGLIFDTESEAKAAWNRAMGMKEGVE